MKLFATIMAVGVLYLGGAAIPAHWFWFDPNVIFVEDSIRGHPPKIKYSRWIKRESMIRYAVVVRDTDGDIVCEGGGGPFPYRPVQGPLEGKDLVWWSGGDERCGRLKPGYYAGNTCWFVIAPLGDLLPSWLAGSFGGLLPAKSICRDINTFQVY